MTLVVGVDPGGKWTGIVAMSDRALVGACVVTRSDGQSLKSYILEVLEAVGDHVTDGAVVGAEGIEAPKPYIDGKLRFTNPLPIMETSAVFGAVLGRWPEVYVVPPGGNGSAPRNAYPAALWGASEPKGTGILRHARSAHDVALQARRLHRTAMAKAKKAS